jgi:hypothetical protein
LRPQTYEEIAEKFGTAMCSTAFGNDSRDHGRGDASPLPPTVHWRNRKITVAGVRRFLMLIAIARWPEKHLDCPRWAQIYRQNNTAVELSRLVGRRLNQRQLSAFDREHVRYLLARVNARHLSPAGRKEFNLARKWVNRWPRR